MIADDWTSDHEFAHLMSRLAALTTPPASCAHVVVRGIRSVFVRRRGVLLRLAGGEVAGAWVLHPASAIVEFSSAADAGFRFETGSAARAHSIYRQRGPFLRETREALLALAEEIAETWPTYSPPTLEELDSAREALSANLVGDFTTGSNREVQPAVPTKRSRARR